MKLDRMPYEPGALVDFYEEGLGALGALCARPWHDRLEVVAEGAAARLWNAAGALHAVELQFVPAGSSGAREAAREVFPGCPLTFRLAEALRPAPVALERVVLAADGPAARPPEAAGGRRRTRRRGVRCSAARWSRSWRANSPACGRARKSNCAANSSAWRIISEITNASCRTARRAAAAPK